MSSVISVSQSTKEKAIKEKGLISGGFDQNKGQQAVQFALVDVLDKKPNKKYKACKHLKSLHDAMEGVERKT